MELKFKCKNCGGEIITKFLKIGEIAVCKSCNEKAPIPKDAGGISVSEPSQKVQSLTEKSESIKKSKKKTRLNMGFSLWIFVSLMLGIISSKEILGTGIGTVLCVVTGIIFLIGSIYLIGGLVGKK
jgi:hypothetical protein